MKQSVITANRVSIGYHKSTYGKSTTLYSDLSFELYSGELTCLLGQNGAGKSTLLRTLSANQAALDGEVLLYDKNIEEYSESDLSYKIGLVLTDKTSIGGFKVEQLVALGRYPYTGFWGKLSKYDEEIIDKSMNDVGIAYKAGSYIAELSDGERQKVMIAKALAQECPIVFLDEPTAFLDVASRIEIMELLHRLASEQNKSILLSTHDIELALLLSDRLWLLSREGGLKCGVTEDIVLSGFMESFLSRNNIAFNLDSGSFYPKRTFKRFAYLQSEAVESRWLRNFMERNFWGITSDKEKARFCVSISSKNEIEVVKNNEKLIFISFQLFSDWITENT